MPAAYDLHLHTCWSYDATAEPEAHFRRARELGVQVIAITEHHVLDSQPELRALAEQYPEVRCIPSAELTVTTSIGPVDLLCYGFPAEPTPELRRVLERYHEWQRAYGAGLSRAVRALGHEYSDAQRLELLRSYRPERCIAAQGATHVKNQIHNAYFIARGFAKDEADVQAFRARMQRAVELPPYPRVAEVVPAVKACGALVAIAHPHGYFKAGDERRMDALREECALDGIECAHQGVPPEFTPRYRAYCERHGLFSTGGSDSHSQEDIDRRFAGHGGGAAWLAEFLERLP
ncbi:MAG: PHP domain-containing protein [Planctomycetota bacterium]|nr:PHP domain-containing protein [Planctomycetota bacterium]